MNLPKAWIEAGTKAKAEEKARVAAAKVEARIDMSAEVAGQGLCPDCRGQMERGVSNGINVWYCNPDRIAIPIADDQV